jgi:hypothetical protein
MIGVRRRCVPPELTLPAAIVLSGWLYYLFSHVF